MSVTNLGDFKKRQAENEAEEAHDVVLENVKALHAVDPNVFTQAVILLYEARRQLPFEERRKIIPDLNVEPNQPTMCHLDVENIYIVAPVTIMACRIEAGLDKPMACRAELRAFLKREFKHPASICAQQVVAYFDKLGPISLIDDDGVLAFVMGDRAKKEYIVLSLNLKVLVGVGEPDPINRVISLTFTE